MGTSLCAPPSLPVDHLVNRVRGEYLEMPGLRLTLPQAQRLFGLDPSACAMVLEKLTREKFLCNNGDGRFAQGQPSSGGALHESPPSAWISV